VANVQAPSPELLLATMSSTASLLSSNTQDLSKESISLSRNIVSATMKAALSLDVPVESITIYNAVIDGCIDVSASKTIDNSMKSNIQSMYESYVDTIGKTAMKNSSSSSNITITTSNMQIIVNKVKPTNTISSLTSKPSHELSILSSSVGSHGSVYDHNIPLLLSVTRASLYDTSTTTATNNSSVYKIASNPLRMQLDCSLMNSTQVRLVLQNTETQSFAHIPPITKPVKTICEEHNKVEHSYMCEYTDMSTYNITVKCDGSKNMTYITECPKRLRLPSCGVLSSVGKCSLVSYNNEKMICSCDICSTSDMSRRKLSLTTIAYQVAGIVEVVYEEFVSVSTQPMTAATVESTLIVSLTYAVVWIVIILSVPVKRIIYQRLDKARDASKSSTKIATVVVPEDSAESIALESRLRDYINIYLPNVYKEDQSYIMRLITQIVKNHLYLSLFLKSKHNSMFLNYLEAFKILTVMSSSIFILVVIYNAQYPSDDESCDSFNTMDTCLSRKNFHGKEYCAWEDGKCIFNEYEYTVFEEIFLAWIQLIILAPISALTSYAFDKVILAPTSTYVQDQLMVSHGTSTMLRRISQIGNGIRRMSLAVGNQARRLSSAFASKVSDADIKKRALSVKSTILLDRGFVDKRRHALDLLQHHHHQRHDEFKIELEDATDFDIAQAFYQKFTGSFNSHRKHLSESDKSKFDHIWTSYFPTDSINTTNLVTTDINTSTDENTNTTAVSVHKDAKFKSFSSLLFSEMLLVQETANEIYNNIKDAPTHIVGAELLKTFLIDLLGRDTNESKIFEASFESNIKTTKVVSLYLKVFMILVMVGLNIYFVYTSMLYCSDKDYEWQVRWMAVFLVTLGVDISFNYMSEAYLLSFLLPMTINSKIGITTTITTATIITNTVLLISKVLYKRSSINSLVILLVAIVVIIIIIIIITTIIYLFRLLTTSSCQ